MEDVRIEEVTAIPQSATRQSSMPGKNGNDIALSSISTGAGESTLQLVDDQQTTVFLGKWRLQAVNLAVCMSLFLSDLEMTIISTSLLSITNALAEFQKSSWVVTAYLLTFTGFLVIIAKLSDIYGRKALLTISLIIFTVFSVACGFAQTLTQLVVFRAFQGIGGGGMHAMSWVILPEMVPKEKYTLYASIVSSTFALASLLGPLLGGLINNHTTWRWIFLLNAPAGVFTIVLVLLALPSNFPHLSTKPRRFKDMFTIQEIRRIDFLGVFLILAASILFVAALEEGGIAYTWNSPVPLTLLIVSLLLWVGFVLWEMFEGKRPTAREPVLPWRVVTNRFTMGTLLNSFFVGSVFFAIVINLPQKFQVVNGVSPLDAGYRLIALTVSVSVGAGISAQLVQTLRLAPFYVLLGGAVMQTVGLGLMVTLSVSQLEIQPAQYGYEVILGIGFGLSLGSVVLMTTIVFEQRDTAIAMGSVAQFRFLGASVILAICTNVLNNRVTSELASSLSRSQLAELLQSAQSIKGLPVPLQQLVREVYAKGFREQLQVMTAFSAAAVLATLLMSEKRPRRQG